jgi:hypothetical protein
MEMDYTSMESYQFNECFYSVGLGGGWWMSQLQDNSQNNAVSYQSNETEKYSVLGQ